MKEKKDKTTAILFAIFLGGIGIHRFYVGQILYGILYLIFSWTFVPLFLGLLDAFVWMLVSKDDFDGKYNSEIKELAIETNSTSDISEQISRYHDLLKSGALTEEEYLKLKSALISDQTKPE